MPATRYRFLPWARRGLVDRVAIADEPGAAIPARAQVSVGLTVSGTPTQSQSLDVYGPGDVLGVDPRLIVRLDPRANSTDVEPNYFPLIEFDPPDFPWMFTPARSAASQRLRPWCVLVVIDTTVVAVPRMQVGRPLPTITIPAAAIATELPDLSESWAWAHAQVLGAANAANIDASLESQPELNVSRIVAPRRLAPNKAYAACLVPAFSVGVARGLGDEPAVDAMLAPAWLLTATSDVTLPVYFHWEFSTGPAGDFEMLARRLAPFKADERMGVERMFVGGAGPELPLLPPTNQAAFLDMEGALRSPARSATTLDDVPSPMRNALQTVLDAAAATASGGTPTVLGPPLYGAFHARQHTVPAVDGWMRALNLDPRTRAAAGLGAEIVRLNQEEFMQWCWEQVGAILEANRLLARARLSMEALTRLHVKHLSRLPADLLLGFTAPLSSRTKLGTKTVLRAIADSSMPDAIGDPALRRLVSAQRPVLRATLRRTLVAGADATAVRVRMAKRFAAGELAVDPTQFIPEGLLGIPRLESLSLPTAGDAAVDLSSLGLPLSLPASVVRQLRDDTRTVQANTAPKLVARSDIRTVGVAGETQLTRIRELIDTGVVKGGNLSTVLAGVIRNRLPGDIRIISGTTPRRGEPTVPPLIKDVATITRLEGSLTRIAPAGTVGLVAPVRSFVAFGIETAQVSVITRTNPRLTVPRRLNTLLSANGTQILTATVKGIVVSSTQDRVMAAPVIDVALYEYLARIDAARFLPGVGAVPEDGVTLLETNPRFVEALLAGANTEMNRELLWRSFPTDQRGTPLRRFWDWSDGGSDIPPMHEWPAAASLGSQGRSGAGGQVVLLVRGRLLRRYPNAVVLAWKAQGAELKQNPGSADLQRPVFAGRLGVDMAFFGFALDDRKIVAGDGWFFVIQEQPTEPRFGFDELRTGAPLPALVSWSDATWEHTATIRGAWLRIGGNPLANRAFGAVRFVDHAASLAALSIQKPMRVAFHAKSLVR